ncbi:LysR family transcriptional regulator [uncultured Nitratireductor sp.]|uniref:LysR family transcriptional regulator n=1 Tax=uncultured Nitratireductor sp. TaxID=520953 RepID=UPI0025FC8C5F|nr:LysR family transcriptional regulator [uncultured Nitratireductor sp.]
MKKNFTKPVRGLDSVSAFLRVVERQSFRAAASDLGVSPSAVSQAVRSLEARVGVALVSRSTRSVGLTEAGQRFLERAKPAMENLDAAFEAARSLAARPSGLLRITVPRSVMASVLEPALPAFCTAYPDIDIEIVADSGFVDIVSEGFDAGIRLGELVHADMIGVRLTPPFRYCVVGAPSYFEQHGRPLTPADLGNHRALRYRQQSSGGIYRWEFLDKGREIEIGVPGPLTLNDETLLPSMASNGLGLAYLAEPLVRESLKRGDLETVLDRFCPQSPGLFLYYPGRAQSLPKLKVFVEHMIRQRPSLEARMTH